MSVDHWALHILNLDNGKLNLGSCKFLYFFKSILSSLAEECARPRPLLLPGDTSGTEQVGAFPTPGNRTA